MKRTAIVLIVGVLALAAGLWIGGAVFDRSDPAPPELGDAIFVYPQPQAVPTFSLHSHDEAVFDNARLLGKWSLLFFGYTHCPDVCPLTLQTFRAVHEILTGGEGKLDDIQFVFISVDPERDTPETLAKYVRFFDPGFIGATGPKEVLDPLTSALHIVYLKVPGQKPEDYLIDHSAAILLTNPDGQLFGVFTPPHDANAIAEVLQRLRSTGPEAASNH